MGVLAPRESTSDAVSFALCAVPVEQMISASCLLSSETLWPVIAVDLPSPAPGSASHGGCPCGAAAAGMPCVGARRLDAKSAVAAICAVNGTSLPRSMTGPIGICCKWAQDSLCPAHAGSAGLSPCRPVRANAAVLESGRHAGEAV